MSLARSRASMVLKPSRYASHLKPSFCTKEMAMRWLMRLSSAMQMRRSARGMVDRSMQLPADCSWPLFSWLENLAMGSTSRV